MTRPDAVLTKIRKICLSLPDTKETLTWGKPHFRVGDKIFAGYGDEAGRPALGFKLEMKHARAVIKDDPRFQPAPYVGHKGWVSMDVTAVKDWDELRGLILESYRLIASKKSRAKLEEGAAPPRPKAAARPSVTRKSIKPRR